MYIHYYSIRKSIMFLRSFFTVLKFLTINFDQFVFRFPTNLKLTTILFRQLTLNEFVQLSFNAIIKQTNTFYSFLRYYLRPYSEIGYVRKSFVGV